MAKKTKDNFPVQKEWITGTSEREEDVKTIGGIIYDTETLVSKRVFTLRTARKYDLAGLRAVLRYMTAMDKFNMFGNEKAVYSFQNILRALEEKTPPPTKEQEAAVEQVIIDFKRKYPEFFGNEYKRGSENA